MSMIGVFLVLWFFVVVRDLVMGFCSVGVLMSSCKLGDDDLMN